MTLAIAVAHRLRRLSAVAFAGAGLCVGCATTMDSNSGGDNVRGKAVEVKVGQTHDDFISADKGDHTDWKKIVLPEPTVLAIHAYWDDPSVQVKVTVRDQFGGQVFALAHSTGAPADHWTGMKLREGDYFLELVSSRGSSVYTLEAEFEGGGGGGGDGDVAPPE
jgi:hypothetical protein